MKRARRNHFVVEPCGRQRVRLVEGVGRKPSVHAHTLASLEDALDLTHLGNARLPRACSVRCPVQRADVSNPRQEGVIKSTKATSIPSKSNSRLWGLARRRRPCSAAWRSSCFSDEGLMADFGAGRWPPCV
jgi:hypothetical protein